jgi:hypothetical protein
MTSCCKGNLPYEFDPDESEVRIWFDHEPREPRTRDNPGCDASVEITQVRRLDNDEELSISRLPAEVMEAFEWDVWNYLETLEER